MTDYRVKNRKTGQILLLLLPAITITTVALLTLAALRGTVAHPPEVHLSDDALLLVSGQNQLAMSLYRQLAGSGDSFFFSPYGVTTMLAVFRLAAEGGTAEQLSDVLNCKLPGPQLFRALCELEKSLQWYRQGWNVKLETALHLDPPMGVALKSRFENELSECLGKDFTITQQDQTAVPDRNRTAGETTDIQLAWVHNLSFDGEWQHPFRDRETQPTPFYLPGGDSIQVEMMNQEGMFRYSQNDSLQILELPYSGETTSLLIMLPRAGIGLGKIEQQLTVENLEVWLSSLQEREVVVSLPRFHQQNRLDLVQPLQRLGLTAPFNCGAEFSLIESNLPQWLATIYQKSFIEVTEEGTRAEALTFSVIVMSRLPEPPRPEVFNADHPFIYLLRENRTGLLLFCGRVLDPRESGAGD